MRECGWGVVPDPQFTEAGVGESKLVGPARLFEDFLTMGDEKQAGIWNAYSQVGVVDGRHDRLAGTGSATSRLRWYPRVRDNSICCNRASWKGCRRSSVGQMMPGACLCWIRFRKVLRS